jgi:hypothetical protein
MKLFGKCESIHTCNTLRLPGHKCESIHTCDVYGLHGHKVESTQLFAFACLRLSLRKALRVVSIFLLGAISGSALAQEKNAYEPRALQVLQRMADSYRSLTALEQRTEFTMTTIPLPAPDHPFGLPPRPTRDEEGKGKREKEKEGEGQKAKGETPTPNTENQKPETENQSPVTSHQPPATNHQQERKLDQRLRLRFAEPNRLRLEIEDKDPLSNLTLTSAWVSDGKTFWSFMPEKNWYTREKAPGRMRDFPRLKNLNATTLELLMLMGLNPFKEIKEVADSVRYIGEEALRGMTMEVIALRSSTRREETEVRFYVGKSDGLMHRLVHELTPVVGPAAPGKVGDGLDELIDGQLPPNPPSDPEAQPSAATAPQPFRPSRTRLIYDNFLSTQPNFAFDAFLFTIPPGAFLYGPPEKKGNKNQGLEMLREFWKKNRKPQG